ncbi:hypothetical protein HOLleu_01349 [Holothuria leucospilota]|uniref:Ig-like domain-containing protein n=1 Tax=Holothuria leucospilota TaxID=206669 RepID=A0A9Q1CPU2_HOLLE|nr:hypothetical protein HOLleu_01349 [Holothuria leucospilota]
MGRMGIVQCNFEEGFYGVVWYNLEEFSKGHSFLQLINGVKKGEGYLSGDFDVLPNGSLMILNVSLQHDSNFVVSKFRSEDELPLSFDVRVVVTVKPSTAFPVISFCGEKSNTCFVLLDEYSELVCSVKLARPAIDLQWAVRGVHGDDESVFQSSVTDIGHVFTSRVTMINVFPHSRVLHLLVCKADNHYGLLLEEESTIFIEKSDISLGALETVSRFIERDSRLELNCLDKYTKFIVWKKANHRDDTFQVLSYAALFTGNVLNVYSNDFELQKNGSLVLPRTETRHEALYGCISQSENSSKAALFNVVVFVHLLVLAYPVISGCTQYQYCFLEAPAEGSLKCAVRGVRPRVKLEWKTLAKEDSALIIFTNHEVTVNSIGDVYDVILTSTYRVEDTATDRLTLECRMTSSNISELTSAAKFDLFITNGKIKFRIQNVLEHEPFVFESCLYASCTSTDK